MLLSRNRILFEDEHLLAINKLSGELVVKGKGKVEKLPLLDFLKKDFPKLRALHRLDFETSGVVVFAKTKEAAGHDFEGWRKTYRALVAGRIGRSAGTIQKKLPARGTGMLDAVTRYSVLNRFANSTYIEAVIETGRHHQIRKHFQSIGHPLVLDSAYGDLKFNRVFTQEFRLRRFFLHAASISFPHPVTKKQISIEAPLPKAFVAIIKELEALG